MSILVHWFLTGQCSLLPFPAWPPQFTLIHGRNISGSYAILFFTALDVIFTTRHIHSWALFLLWPSHFILSGAISNCPSLFPGSILDTYQPGGLIFQCRVFLPFHMFTGFLRQEYWSGLPFPPPVGQILPELFAVTHLSWVTLQGMTHNFIELCEPLHKLAINEGRYECTIYFAYLWILNCIVFLMLSYKLNQIWFSKLI